MSVKFCLLVGVVLLGTTGISAWKINLNESTIKIHMDSTVSVQFNVTDLPATSSSKVEITAESSDTNIATISLPVFRYDKIENGVWKDFINVTGVFLGKAKISVTINHNGEIVRSNESNVIVTRRERVIDIIFTASVAILVSILYINFGCAMDWDLCKKTLRRPVGPVIGFVCQFLFMPLISYVIGYVLFPDYPEMQLGIFFTGISPSGGASNIWTLMLGGNLNLSITMTTLCTIGAFAFIPFWLFTLGKHIFDRGTLKVPYSNIATYAIALVVPLGIGFLLQRKMPRFSKMMVRIMKPFSIILIIFIIIFAIVTNLYLFKLFSWKIILSGLGLPWLGYILGLTMALIFKQPGPDVRAISIETGIQNTGISIFLLRFGLEQPEADLTTVAPVSCAIMTPLPLILLYIIKLILDRRKEKLAASMEKLQNSVPAIKTLS
ncbi:ileal sodium/bile acid cotransporter [Leptopilina heterotoma]|uniref:ileal sodium/bile acid cotransporter n=1 Tax=Leptopilina heterotoma TaxID=63436 RepID=UPI001CA8EA2C|nr:ileal sodium/bile acid cotransporter [Leptopilina heterotoma]XP_043477278.1 ileal sodium/bile acid cotransporter [Leptopilina heterotoma]